MAAGEGEGLLFYEDDGRVVFTNTPSRSDVRPVPGLEVWRTIEFDDPRLPVTIYDPFIENVARENGLSAALIKAVALAESGFDPHAVSPKGAQGLMQLMPETARQYGVEDAFDPLQNLRAGALHLRGLLDEFDGESDPGARGLQRRGGSREAARRGPELSRDQGVRAQGPDEPRARAPVVAEPPHRRNRPRPSSW